MLVNKYPNRILENSNLYFGGTDYLGIQHNKIFISILQKNIEIWGTCYGSSRNANIKLAIYDEFEKYFASFLEFKDLVSVSSGTLASIIVKEIYDSNIKRFHLKNSHPSIIFNNSKLIFVNGKLNPLLLTNQKEEIIICVDAILSLETSVTDLGFLTKINSSKEITLIIDESHSLGILGKNGNGISSSLNYPFLKRQILISSLSKAFGISGGIIASDTNFISKIKNHKLFIGAAGTNPAFLQTIIDAKDLYQKQLQVLQFNLKYFYSKLYHNNNYSYSKEYPVLYYSNELNKLLNNIIITTNFNYNDTIINRIVIKANHTHSDLDKLLTLLNKKRGCLKRQFTIN